MQPDIIVKKFMLVGIETHIDFSSDFTETLNQLDSRLHLYLEQIKHTKQPLKKIGFWQPGGIYFAGVEVTQVKDVPTECSVKDLPESLFAVFHENRRGTIGGPKGYAYSQWLPSSAYLVNEDLPGDFEIFDNMECCSEEDPCCIWIPIKKKYVKRFPMSIKTKAPLRILCDGCRGENYWLHGCMTYLAACLGLHEKYNYQFFNCYSGDSVTQVFSKDPCRDVWSYSHECTAEALARCFHAIGYSYTYVSSVTDPAEWLPKIRESLNGGLPVFARGGGNTDGQEIEFNCIVGYDDDALYYLFCDEDKVTEVTKYDFRELVFVGEKTAEPFPFADGYLEALRRVPELLTKPAADKFSFGIQALSDWAEQLENGILAEIPPEKLTVWGIHGTYLCMLGSNGGGYGLYDKVLQFYPEMTWLGDVQKRYEELSEIFQTLAYRDGGVCGGFDMELEDARNPEKMQPVCALIRRAAELTGEIAEIIQKNIHS